MRLSNIDKYITELRALKEYDGVKEERERALKEAEEYKQQFSDERAKVDRLSREIDDLRKNQREKDDELDRSRSSVNIKGEELQKKGEQVNTLRNRIKELEAMKTFAEGKTLREAEDCFVKAKEEEISRSAKTLFDNMKLSWEKGGRPVQVRNDAISLLKLTVNALRRAGSEPLPDEVTSLGIDKDVKEILNSEVQAKLDHEFARRVEGASEVKATEKLEHLISAEWPAWYRMNVEPKIGKMESMIKANVLIALKGPWIVRCDKCGTEQTIQVFPDDIERMITNGKLYVECVQVNCKDFFGRHGINVWLRDLLRARLSN